MCCSIDSLSLLYELLEITSKHSLVLDTNTHIVSTIRIRLNLIRIFRNSFTGQQRSCKGKESYKTVHTICSQYDGDGDYDDYIWEYTTTSRRHHSCSRHGLQQNRIDIRKERHIRQQDSQKTNSDDDYDDDGRYCSCICLDFAFVVLLIMMFVLQCWWLWK